MTRWAGYRCGKNHDSRNLVLLYVFLASLSGLCLVCASVSSVWQQSWCGAILVTRWTLTVICLFPTLIFLHTFVTIFCTSSSLGSKINLINCCYSGSVRLYPIDCAIFGVGVSTRRV